MRNDMALRLRTWKLTPTNIPSSLWLLSTHRKEIFVRAATPLEARYLAASKFERFPDTQPRDLAAKSPWIDPDLAECCELRHALYDGLNEPSVFPVPDNVEAARTQG